MPVGEHVCEILVPGTIFGLSEILHFLIDKFCRVEWQDQSEAAMQ